MCLGEGSVGLGFVGGSVANLRKRNACGDFYMNRVGRWLGMDGHDVGEYRGGEEWRVLEPGMVMTVEPGLYISESNTNVAKKWRGIGIRIEDDVVVTEEGCDVITAGVPKTIEEIEALMAA